MSLDSLEITDEVVSKVIDALKTKISEFHFNNWFKNTEWKHEGCTTKIEVPNKFVRDWIHDNYLELIKFEFFRITNQEHEVSFHINKSLQTEAAPETGQQTLELIPPKKETTEPKIPQILNTRYTFENFVVGNSNQFVHAACRAVASNPAKNYNPLFIYGGVGLGKTHLLNAMGLHILKDNPSWKVVLVSGEKFTNEVINSIRYDKTYDLRQKYRVDCDVLMIDDVQFIAGKERTMEEFFHTFNALYEARKQIVLTSDLLPKDIPNLEERLRSRFGWGLLADIQSPDFETRSAILRKKAEDEKIELPNDVCEFIANNIKMNVRELEGSLIRISAFASLSNAPITVELAKEVLRNLITGYAPQVTIETVQKMVADFFSLKITDLKSPRRHKNLALPRQIAMYLCKKHIKASFPEIGQKFGGKDHTTVIHAVQKITTSINSDATIRDNVTQLEKMMSQNAPMAA